MTTRTQYQLGSLHWGLMALSLLAVYLFSRDAIDHMVELWLKREEYSHGFLIPVVSAFLVWQRSDRLRAIPFTGSWLGLVLLVLGLALVIIGEAATLYPVVQYGFIVSLLGACWAWLGLRAFREVLIPLAILFFMVPLPNFLYNNLSSELQLLSSQLGVAVIRLFGISVFLEGNVIDLGALKLQVVDACSGLRYLFPLMTLGFIMACFYQAHTALRAVVFLSTVPITIGMNSLRIGLVGVTVEHFGLGAAEGILHDFEGWVVFMGCFLVLLAEMRLLMLLSGDRRRFNQVFGVTFPEPPAADAPGLRRSIPSSAWVSVSLLLVALGAALALPEREELIPPREPLIAYPLKLAGLEGRFEPMAQHYIDALKFDDYLMVNYRDPAGSAAPLNWYVAWYDSQRKGQSAHSPKSCLPGGGWRISEFGQRSVPGVTVAGHPLRVNRSLIRMGEQRQLVYYWFQQRGRVVTNEYLVKWYLFVDALLRNRTDGALVRLMVPVPEGSDVAEADARLAAFLAEAVPALVPYVPD